MKILRTLLIILVVLIAIVGILSLVAPAKMAVSRSIVINAPKEVVWNNVSRFENTQNWTPWNKRDPNIKTSMEGTDGTVGAKSSWESKVVGTGSQTIAALDPMNRVDTKLDFIKPFKSHADAFTLLADTAGGVKVTWGFNSAMPKPFNVMGLFMNMTSALEKDYDEGLHNLKSLSEQEATTQKTYGGYKISEVEMPAKTYVGKRETVSFQNIGKFFDDNVPKIANDVQSAKLEMAGTPSGLYYTFDTVKMVSDMAAVVPVKEATSSVGKWQTINVPAGKAIEIDYYGPYTKMEPVYIAFDKYVVEKGLKPKSFSIEEYVTGPMTEKDTAKWFTKIYYYVQ